MSKNKDKNLNQNEIKFYKQKRIIYSVSAVILSGLIGLGVYSGVKHHNELNSLSTIGDKDYSTEELEGLLKEEKKTYEVTNVNEAILYKVLDMKTTSKIMKQAEEMTQAGIKETGTKLTEKQITAMNQYYARNLVLQDYYERIAKVSDDTVEKAYKDGYSVESFLQVYTLGEGTDDLVKKVKVEVDKVKDVKVANAMIKFYGGETSMKVDTKKYKFNKELKDIIGVSEVSFTPDEAKGVFDDAIGLKPFKSVKIGKDGYVGYLIKLEERKLSKDEIKVTKIQSKIQSGGYYSTIKMLQKIDLLESKIKFSKDAQEKIESGWK